MTSCVQNHENIISMQEQEQDNIKYPVLPMSSSSDRVTKYDGIAIMLIVDHPRQPTPTDAYSNNKCAG